MATEMSEQNGSANADQPASNASGSEAETNPSASDDDRISAKDELSSNQNITSNGATPSSESTLKQLLAKLETLRSPQKSIIGAKYTCFKVRIFTIVYSTIVTFMVALSYYRVTISNHIQRRYNFAQYEIDFIHGADKIPIVCCLLFIAYYGNKLHKPLTIMTGALIYALGAIIFATPYWSLGMRKSYKEANITTYLQSGLCQIGYGPNSTLRSETYSEQCDYFPPSLHESENRGAYSLMCFAQLLMGAGISLVLPLGVIYIEEAERKTKTTLYIGGVLLAYSFGAIIGTLFGTWFITYPEDLNDKLHIAHWHVGAWWVGFPLFASLLIVAALFLLIFPRWIREPKWLLYRRYREIKREHKQQQRDQEERRRRRQKKREKKKRERERKNIHARQAAAANSMTSLAQVDVTIDSESTPNELSDSDSSHSTEQGVQNSAFITNNSDELNTNNNNGQTDSDSENTPTNTENALPTKPDIDIGENTFENTDDAKVERAYKPRSERKGVRIHTESRDHEAEAEVKDQWVKDEEKENRATRRNETRAKLGRKLKDLPENLKYLVVNPFYTLTTLAIAASCYCVAGNQHTVPAYLEQQYHYEADQARLISGLVFGLAMLMGVLISTCLLYIFNYSLVRQYQAVMVCSGIVCLGPLLSFAFQCDVEYGKVEYNDLEMLQPSCAIEVCDCSESNYYPVCSNKGVRYYSPCHAGCNVAELRNTETGQEYYFSSCVCIGETGDTSMTYCDDSCAPGGGYVTILFFTLVAHAMCYTTIILIYLRAYAEKLRSLAFGFAVWITYVFAIVPGTAIYNYCTSTACELSRKNCDEDKECWRINSKNQRNYTQGTTFVFLVVACVLFIVAYKFMDKQKLQAEVEDAGGKKERKSGRQNVGYRRDHGDNDSTV